MAPSGFVAVIAGWITTEVGRQPYVIYDLLRTADAASPLDAPAVAASLLAFVLVYFAVFGVGVWYILRLMQQAAACRRSRGQARRYRADPHRRHHAGPDAEPGRAPTSLPDAAKERWT